MRPDIFADYAINAFSFLEKEFSFSSTWQGGYAVRFDAKDVFVAVEYQIATSLEIHVKVGLTAGIRHQVERPFEIWEILHLFGVSDLPEACTVKQVRPEEVQQYLPHLASILRSVAKPLLAGEYQYFDALDQQRERDCNLLDHQTQLKYARKDAEEAWRASNFKKVIELLASFEEDLTPAEKKRVEIARKKAQ
ncbi:MAG: hypothetical protein ACJ8C4_10620 [Gemmataceae bacterium]